MKSNNKKKAIRVIVSISTAAVLIAAFLVSFALFHISSNSVIGEVDGAKIYAGELKLQTDSKKAEVLSYFEDKYDITADKDFWTTEFDGITPEQYLKKQALEEVKRYKLQLCLGQKYGLVDDLSFKGLKNAQISVNNENEKKIAAGQAIYGQREYSLTSYYEYRLSNLQLDLQKCMSKQGEPLYADKTALKSYYESVKDKYYKKQDTAKFIMLSVSVKDADGRAEKEMLDNAARLIESEGIDKAKNEITRKYGEIKWSEITLDEGNYSSLSKQNQSLYEQAISIKKKELTGAVRDSDGFKMLYCVSKDGAGYKSFEEVETTLSSQYVQDKYEQYVDELCAKYEVVTNRKYDRLSVNDSLD